MGMTILERLSKEALARGYSWRRIDEACRISWQEESEKATGIVLWKSKPLVEDSYNALKKGSTQNEENPLTLEVKVTKR